MSSMEYRFKRAFKVLDEDSKSWSEEEFEAVISEGLNLMWLRNEAKLWSDYEEDADWLLDGVQYDPNHPDNLSDSVFKLWKQTKGYYDIKFDKVTMLPYGSLKQ